MSAAYIDHSGQGNEPPEMLKQALSLEMLVHVHMACYQGSAQFVDILKGYIYIYIYIYALHLVYWRGTGSGI